MKQLETRLKEVEQDRDDKSKQLAAATEKYKQATLKLRSFSENVAHLEELVLLRGLKSLPPDVKLKYNIDLIVQRIEKVVGEGKGLAKDAREGKWD
jgi:hypothetical protein